MKQLKLYEKKKNGICRHLVDEENFYTWKGSRKCKRYYIHAIDHVNCQASRGTLLVTYARKPKGSGVKGILRLC